MRYKSISMFRDILQVLIYANKAEHIVNKCVQLIFIVIT